MSWLAWNPTAREELADLDRRDLHDSLAADRRERTDRFADQDSSSITSVARQAPSPDGVASCSETLEERADRHADIPFPPTKRERDDLADWQHLQALRSDGICLACEGSGEVVWNPSRIGDPQMEQSARCPECQGEGER